MTGDEAGTSSPAEFLSELVAVTRSRPATTQDEAVVEADAVATQMPSSRPSDWRACDRP
jgi:hypothetical protein